MGTNSKAARGAGRVGGGGEGSKGSEALGEEADSKGSEALGEEADNDGSSPTPPPRWLGSADKPYKGCLKPVAQPT